MSIDAKHFYRFKYLKSEHWQNLRLAKLAMEDAKCKRCSHRDPANDVHHLLYKKLYDVTVEDLVVLCRKCHSEVHKALEVGREFVKRWKDDGPKAIWRTTNRIFRWFHLIDKFGIDRSILKHADNPHFSSALGRYCKYIERGSSISFEQSLEEATASSVDLEARKSKKACIKNGGVA